MIIASVMERRTSMRLKNIPESKKPYYGPSSIDSEPCQKKRSAPKKQKISSFPNISVNIDQGIARTELDNKPVKSYCKETAELKIGRKGKGAQQSEKITESSYSDGNAQLSIDDKGDHSRVKETLKIYNSHYLRLAQEDQEAIARGDIRPAKQQKTQTGGEIVKIKKVVNRFDLQAASKMSTLNEILYPQKKIGNLPGIDVGFRFYSRCEMVAVGFHSPHMSGIDYMGKDYAKEGKEYKDYKFPLAVSIVISGHYKDDIDEKEDVWYTGQGGNDLLGSKEQYKDQKLTSGNLALVNNIEQSQPVRVIRGNESGDRKCPKIYIYDGLYKVVEYVREKGKSGFVVFKFRLKREPGQPKLTSEQVLFARGHKPYTKKKFRGLLSLDIANGQEGKGIRVINTIDSTVLTGFTYTNCLQVSEGIKLPENAEGCKCQGNCTDAESCACAILNGNKFPYVRVKGGSLIRAEDVVYECGPNCGCGPSCINRISQRKLKYKLEIYKTQEKGWAVRSGDFISQGAPVCEYLGVLRKTSEMDSASTNDYIFEIDCQLTMKGIGGRQRRSTDASVTSTDQANIVDDEAPDPDYLIDAGSVGNVARFINHSCEPNLFVQCVLSSHHDPKLARIVLFASENISPFEELTYDYGYSLDSVVGPDGVVKKLECHCGAADCRKRLY